jgi:predicted neuraminidase
MDDGDYLLPAHQETGSDTEIVPPDSCSLFFRYDPAAKTWTPTNKISSRLGNIQPAAARIDGNHLVAYCRRGGDYFGRKDGYLVRTESRDGGRTWSPGADSQFPNPNSAVDFVRLRNGHLLLAYNDSMIDRRPLTVAISTDGDRTYPHKRDIVSGQDAYSYPWILEASDGRIHLFFTSGERSVINHAVFEEDDILGRHK